MQTLYRESWSKTLLRESDRRKSLGTSTVSGKFAGYEAVDTSTASDANTGCAAVIHEENPIRNGRQMDGAAWRLGEAGRSAAKRKHD